MAGIDNNTLLYLRGDSFVDLSLNNYTITNTGFTTANGGIFGNYIDFTVGGKRLTVNGLKLPSPTFTVDWWELNKGVGSTSTATALVTNLSMTSTTYQSLIIGKTTSTVEPVIYSSPVNGSSWEVSAVKIGSNNTSSWVHRAVVYDGVKFITFENGVKYTEVTTTGITQLDEDIIIGQLRENTASYNAYVSELRISNNVRWTEDFEPPTKPYTSVSLSILNQNDNEFNFSVTKESVNESIDKVDILLNGNVVQTYTEGFDSINYSVNKDACYLGGNDVEIRAYYYNDFYESNSFVYNKSIDKLEEQPSLPEIVDKLNEVKNNYSMINDNLYNVLSNEGIDVTAEDKRMNTLVRKVGEFTNETKNKLVEVLIAKNISCSTSNTFEELINIVNELSLNPFSEWAKANCWLAAGSCTALPATTYSATAQAYKGKIYVIGGVGTTTANRVYDPKYNTWSTATAMPTGRYGLDSTIIDDKIYCIGGYNNLTTNQVYDITNDEWTTLAVMPTGREYLTVDAVGTNIYAIGGSGSTTYLNTNQCYDTLTNTWTTKTTMTVAKYDHASGVIGTDIYCIAGYTGSLVGTNYKYDTTTDAWTTMKAATSRRGACCSEVNGKLYYNHGSNASTTYYANNYMYDPVANTWTTMTTGITASKAKYRTSAVVNDMIFVFGGYNGSALNLVDCYIV